MNPRARARRRRGARSRRCDRLDTSTTAGAADRAASVSATANPSSSGSCTSSSTTSGCRSRAATRAAAPSPASPTTSNPSATRSRRASARNGAWSSTMSTRTAMPRCSTRLGRPHHRVNPARHPGTARYCRAACRWTVLLDRSRDRGARHVSDRHLDPASTASSPSSASPSSCPGGRGRSTRVGLAPTAFFPCGPLVAALVVIGVTEGRAGYRDLGARMIRWRVGWMWWLVAVGTPLAVLAVAAAANVAIWGAPAPVLATMAWSQHRARRRASGSSTRSTARWARSPAGAATRCPQLQARRSPLVVRASSSARIVALWHLPLVATRHARRRSACRSRSPSPWSTCGCSTAPAAACC